jgi:hypothetical protein
MEIRPEVAERLGYYVYLYIDPRDGKPFYVGKGKNARTNCVRGWGSIECGRVPLKELTTQYTAAKVEVKVPALLIRINRLFRHTMSDVELYEATRGVWKLSARRRRAKYAFSVFNGVIREVFAIDSWHESGTTDYATRNAEQLSRKRWEFIGHLAEPSVRDAYLGSSVAHYFTPGQQSPTKYVNC